jgi:hypothetical protein
MLSKPHIEDPQTLDEKLREILVSGSLYRTFVYTGRGCHFSNATSRCGALPKQVRMYCDHEKCKAETWWDVDNGNCYFSSGFIKERRYTCRNCGKNAQYYQLIWRVAARCPRFKFRVAHLSRLAKGGAFDFPPDVL